MTVYGFSFSMTEPLRSGVAFAAESVRLQKRLRVLYDAMKVVAVVSQECELKWFVVQTKKCVNYVCSVLLVPYYCDNVEGK